MLIFQPEANKTGVGNSVKNAKMIIGMFALKIIVPAHGYKNNAVKEVPIITVSLKLARATFQVKRK